jgi:hypothetical protein
MVMTFGISQDPFNPPSALDPYSSSRETAAATDHIAPRPPDKYSWSEKTAFEWVSPAVRKRRDGILGIEYDGHGLVVIGMQGKRSGAQNIEHVLVTRCAESADQTTVVERLRSFVGYDRPDVNIVLSTPRAVVRHFLLPPIHARQRLSAALWEGQKLIPFSLKDGGALFSVDFVSAGDKGWWTTLVAVPAEDAAPIFGAVDTLGWRLRSVSLIGTQRLISETPSGEEPASACISWSDQRGCFTIYHRNQLVFHYDLGPMPSMPAGMEKGVNPETMAIWQRWADALGVVVSDALDFHLNVNPTIPPSQLRLYGLPADAAPVLTEWNSRFPGGIILGDPLETCRTGLPEGVDNWLSAHPGSIAPVMAALIGRVDLDLTPERVRQERDHFRRERIARSATVLSVVGCLAWSGMIWSHIANHRAESKQSEEALQQLQTSPVSLLLDQAVASVARDRILLSNVTKSGVAWMPWIKTVLATLPENASLQHIDIGYYGEKGAVVAHLEGTLSPSTLAHAITYREWFDALRAISGGTNPVLASERTLEVLGNKHSAFTIELVAPKTFAPVAREAQ